MFAPLARLDFCEIKCIARQGPTFISVKRVSSRWLSYCKIIYVREVNARIYDTRRVLKCAVLDIATFGTIRCPHLQINHAVLAVGYDTTEDGIDYWIIKNSWGPE